MVAKVRKTAKKAKTKTAVKKKATAKKVKKTVKKAKKATPIAKKKTVKKAASKTAKKAVTRKATKPASKKTKTATAKTKVKPTRKKEVKEMQSMATAPATLILGRFEPYMPKKTEEYMNPKQLQHFRNILNAWKHDLMQEVDHTINEMQEADNLADPNDRASQEESFALELRTRDRERKLLKKIEVALQQIEDDDYGYCEGCGIDIGIRRLEARPTASLCIECKTLAEIREKRA